MISIVTGIMGLLVAAIIIELIRKDILHAQHGFGWFVVALGFALLGFSQQIIDVLAIKRGTGYPPALALTLGFAMLVVKMLTMDIERSRLEVRNQRLIQRMAMRQADMKRTVAV